MKIPIAKKGARSVGQPVSIRGAAPSRIIWQAARRWLSLGWNWVQVRQQARLASKSLHVEENVSLGMKRFVAVVKVGDQRFLLGGGGNDVSLLACLETRGNFQEVLAASAEQAEAQVLTDRKAQPARARSRRAEKCA